MSRRIARRSQPIDIESGPPGSSGGEATFVGEAGSPALRFRAMGTDCLIAVAGTENAATEINRARAEVDRLEAKFSRFRAGSELSRLNRQGGGQMTGEMREVVALAIEMAAETAGLFDPTMLNEIRRVGYDADFAAISRRDAPIQTRQIGGSGSPIRVSRWHEISVEGENLSLPTGTGLDLGGIVKGWAAERVASQIGDQCGALVDLGGDCAVVGPGPDEGTWTIGVNHGGGDLTAIAVEAGAVCTSTTRLRRWMAATGEKHHLLDPSTGNSVESDLVSVTVYDDSAPRAEAWAKSVLIGGLTAGLGRAADAGIEAIATGRLGGVYSVGDVFLGAGSSRPLDRLVLSGGHLLP